MPSAIEITPQEYRNPPVAGEIEPSNAEFSGIRVPPGTPAFSPGRKPWEQSTEFPEPRAQRVGGRKRCYANGIVEFESSRLLQDWWLSNNIFCRSENSVAKPLFLPPHFGGSNACCVLPGVSPQGASATPAPTLVAGSKISCARRAQLEYYFVIRNS